jgi:aromatic-L-amino-acid/L-tryptophan decarboxylase
MTPEGFRAAGHEVVDWLADYLRDVGKYPVSPATAPGDLTRALPMTAPEQGEPIQDILRDFREQIVPGLTHWNHPRFLAYFSISASAPGILGEMLTAGLNVNQLLWKTSPAATELEQVTLGWLRQWLGLPEGFFGLMHDTASTATLHAILAARNQAAPELRTTGQVPTLVLYCSEHAHSSVDKGALAAGVGLNHVRRIACDDAFRLRADLLAEAIKEDRAAGRLPFCVVATVGTTSSASVDPVSDIADITHEHALWLHVDAAYAGTAAMLPEFRYVLDGAERADSLVVNPHKWLFTPLDLSALYLRRPGAMREALALDATPAYLQSSDAAVNLSEYSLALGRRFRSLKLWFVLRSMGREGVSAVLRRHVAAAHSIAATIAAHPQFEVAAPVLFSLVCFRYCGSDDDNRRLLDRVNATGQALLSSTVLRQRVVLRMAIGNIGTTEDDVRAVWEVVLDQSRRLDETLDRG